MWYSHNGERLGTYDGHNGTVWTVDVDCMYPFVRNGQVSFSKQRTAETRFLVSGSADNCMKLWEVSTGKCLYTWEFPTAVKRVAFSEDDSQIVCVTEQRMGYQCAIRIFRVNREGDGRDRKCASPTHMNLSFERKTQNLRTLYSLSIPSVPKLPLSLLPTIRL